MTNKAAKIAKQWLDDADAILVTASNGLSISEGLNLFANDKKLKEVLGDLVDKYHLPNLLTAFAFKYPNQLDYWQMAARVVEYYGNNYEISNYMQDIKKIIGNKSYFVWTSNIDHHFALAGLTNLFEIEGNWFEGVCSNHPAEHGVHYLASKLHEIYEKDQAGTLTEADIPKCDECGAPLALNMAGKDFQINQKQVQAFQDFIQKYEDKKLVVLELGIGPRNQMIKVPSMQLVATAPHAHYITINKGELLIPSQIAEKSIGYSSSINAAFKELLTGKSYGAETQGPAAPEAKPQLTPEQKAKQDKVDSGIRPGSHPMYLTIEKDHPSLLHTVQYGQSWMYSIGDAAIVHCFTQNGQYYKVRLGLDKNKMKFMAFMLIQKPLLQLKLLKIMELDFYKSLQNFRMVMMVQFMYQEKINYCNYFLLNVILLNDLVLKNKIVS
ncbi:Sir2 silent information regulator family NAD-dependent deacetylase [Lactobacillus helveticus]|uniref:Sir2 silent information regulator family NAD-dependent deacetylase n=2 Tax=Lactobacillus helveticus TaxID=1587 RepID=UPI001A07787F|nr:Sir2 silent information regulator family NAD-dependent deacetylase [Lactobacillus helveticus]NRO68014.1 Protein ADP-ribosyltransferase [Lactobacillus helveticus]NRO70047.1 Protein ADP-ribosyltransferase [Lactobacillus helveticus]